MPKQSQNDIVDHLFARWGTTVRPEMDREQLGKVLAISVGLGTIFNESADAERAWMQEPHQSLRTRPITAVLAGSIDEVLDLVNKERGL